MFRLDLILIAVFVALYAIASVLRRAPEGYEDETGFHYRLVPDDETPIYDRLRESLG
jgi:hypothetical protein